MPSRMAEEVRFELTVELTDGLPHRSISSRVP